MRSRQELLARAAEDADLRERLKADPKGTVERELQVNLPADAEVTVLEETPKHAYLVLRAQPPDLSAEELQSVAGGGGEGTPFIWTQVPMCCTI